MKKLLAVLAFGLLSLVVQAAEPDVKIVRVPSGSGSPMTSGLENAQPVGNYGVFHAPQSMPGYPTAATIWPRVVDVPCDNGVCAGYQITPAKGRGEYLFFRTVKGAAPLVQEKLVLVPAPIQERVLAGKIRE